MEQVELIAKVRAQIARARRRIVLQLFLAVLGRSLFVALLIALLAISVVKIWHVGIAPEIWIWSWAGGAVGAGVLFALAWTFAKRCTVLTAAIEVDQRFNLKERVSSTLAMDLNQQQGEIGQALLNDAVRRVERVDIPSKFPLLTGWRALLPILPALAVFAVVQLPDSDRDGQVEAKETPIQVEKQIRKSTENLKKKLVERKQQAEEMGLKDAGDLFDKLQQGIDKMSAAKNVNRKNALTNLSDLGNELKKHRQTLGDSNQIKQQLKQLNDLKRGPANQMVQALKDGDFQQALDQLKNLKSQLQTGNVDAQQQKELTEQLDQVARKMKQISDAHRKAKDALKRKIDQAENQGDKDQAQRLQRKLDKLDRQNQSMERLEQMSKSFGECSECLAQGQKDGQGNSRQATQQALDQLDQLAQDLEQLQQADSELEMIDSALEQLAQAKNAMNCAKCGGMGCADCMGMGNQMASSEMGRGEGIGMGEGQGQGPRPEQETGTGFYDTQVRAKPKRGMAVKVGDAPGPNVSGQAREEIKEQISSLKQGTAADPLTGKRLPKAKRNHVQQYLDSFREGK